MRNAELDEAQAGLKVAERNINNLRHADDTCCLEKDADVGTCEVEHLENSSEGDTVRSGQK